mgnify:CR=1 FL=1
MPAARSVVYSAKLIAVCTLVSRVTGLLRDVLLAQAFGLGWIQDAFSYAFQFPNLFRRLFGEGAMAPVFVPTFTRTLETEGRESAWRLLARTLALMTVALAAVIIVIGLIIAGVWALWPGAAEKQPARQLLLALTAIMLPFMLSICVVALLSSILNCLGSFVPAALTPIVLNAVMIVTLAWLAPRFYPQDPRRQVYVVALAVVLAGILQVAVLLPALRKRGVPLAWRLEVGDPAVRHMLGLLPPVALGQGVLAFGVFADAQICALLTHVAGTPSDVTVLGWRFAYPLKEGALSAITYAQRLYQFPLGVLVISLATAALPAFSRLAARAQWPEWAAEVRQALRLAMFEGLLAGVLMVTLAEPMVRFLFQYGRFTAADTARTSYVVVYYGFGLWAFCAQHIILRAFYSLGDVRTPLLISGLFLPINVALTLALIWVDVIREAAFAISSCTTSILSVLIGSLVLQRRVHLRLLDRGLLGSVARMLLTTAAAAGAIAIVRPTWTAWTDKLGAELLARGSAVFGLLAVGTAAFVLCARLLRLPEVALLLPSRWRRGPRGPGGDRT